VKEEYEEEEKGEEQKEDDIEMKYQMDRKR
jgi:hypothetical protein